MFNAKRMESIANEIVAERARQDERWNTCGCRGGPTVAEARKTREDWCNAVLCRATWARTEDRMESPERYRRFMLEAAAVTVAACEAYDVERGQPS